jgi:hypothetical protein
MMRNKLLIGVGLTLCIAACASTPPARPGAGAPRADNSAPVPPAGCVAGTATRLPVSPRDCAAFGNVYTSKDLKSTGYTQVGQALSTLDPSVTTNTGH